MTVPGMRRKSVSLQYKMFLVQILVPGGIILRGLLSPRYTQPQNENQSVMTEKVKAERETGYSARYEEGQGDATTLALMPTNE